MICLSNSDGLDYTGFNQVRMVCSDGTDFQLGDLNRGTWRGPFGGCNDGFNRAGIKMDGPRGVSGLQLSIIWDDIFVA